MERSHNSTPKSLTCTCSHRWLPPVLDAQLGLDPGPALLLMEMNPVSSPGCTYSPLHHHFPFFIGLLEYSHSIINPTFNKAFLGPFISVIEFLCFNILSYILMNPEAHSSENLVYITLLHWSPMTPLCQIQWSFLVLTLWTDQQHLTLLITFSSFPWLWTMPLAVYLPPGCSFSVSIFN